MGKGETSFANVWDIDTSKYDADGDAASEVKVEVVTSGESGVTQINQEEPEKSDESTLGEDPVKDVVEKQDAAVGTPTDEGKEDASTKTPDEPVKDEPTQFQSLAQGLVDDDVLSYDDDSDKDYDFDTEAGLKELINETVEKKSTAAISAYKENLGDDARKLLEVLEKGGNVADFEKMSKQIDFNTIPLEDKDGNDYQQNQIHLVEDLLKEQEFDEEEIKEAVNDYIEGGILKKQASVARRKLAKLQEKKNADFLAKAEASKAEQVKLASEQAESFKSTVMETRELSGFKVTEVKAKKLYDYITKKDKDGKSKFDREDTAENRLLYAYFAMEGFDKEKLSKDIATKQARTLRKKLSRFNDSNAAPKRSANEVKRTNQDLGNIPWSM
jgi:hypothetical protein